MNGTVVFEKVSGKIHGGTRRNSPDRSRAKAIDARANRRTGRQELIRGKSAADYCMDDASDDGGE